MYNYLGKNMDLLRLNVSNMLIFNKIMYVLEL